MRDPRLRNLLREQSDTLHSRFITIEAQLKSLLEYSQSGGHMTFTPHGLSHISKLEVIYDWLLPDSDQETFNEVEIFVLLVATYMHDMLMIPRRAGDEARARSEHAEGVEQFFTSQPALGVVPHEAQTIADVVRGHDVDDLDELPARRVLGSSTVDIRKLAACLSLADICHADSSRAPEIVYNYLKFDDESAYHWRRHLQISGITRAGQDLLVSASCFSTEGVEAVEDYAETIRTQLQICRPYFDTVLEPIARVELEISRRESPVDMALKFQGNIPRILALLIEGVHSKPDVFLRELVQNGLDACYLAQGAAFARSDHYSAKIVVTEIEDDEGEVVAIRIDDNGIGMSIAEVQDSLLTIASTQADTERVKNLLESTGKSLIAKFGIGLLSCLKVGSNVTVRTKRRGHAGLQLSFRGVDEDIHPSGWEEEVEGSTFIVDLKADLESSWAARDTLEHYLLDVRQASVQFLAAGAGARALSRAELFELAASEGEIVEPKIRATAGLGATELTGDGFRGMVWLEPDTSPDELRRRDGGTLTILNDGILVGRDASTSWLPDELGFAGGFINISAGRVSLSASRESIQQNAQLRTLHSQFRASALRLIPSLAAASAQRVLPAVPVDHRPLPDQIQGPELACAALCSVHKIQPGGAASSSDVLKHLDGYCVRSLDQDLVTLADLFAAGSPVYVVYSRANTVDNLARFDGQQLYTESDPVSFMQARLLAERGEKVVWAASWNKAGFRVKEYDLIEAFGAFRGCRVIDVVGTNPVKGTVRSLGVDPAVRDAVGGDVKFVQLDGFAERHAWLLGGEVWLNVANPDIARVYELAKVGDERVLESLPLLLSLYRADFDAVAQSLFRRMTS